MWLKMDSGKPPQKHKNETERGDKIDAHIGSNSKMEPSRQQGKYAC